MQIMVQGLLVNYEYLKKGEETIVFLHGWGGSINSFKGAFNYFKNSNYSLLNLDLPAFGESTEPPESFCIYDYANIVTELIKLLNIKSVHLVSHSFGGRIAIILSALKQINIKTLTLVASAGIKPKKSFKTRFQIAHYKLLKKIVKNKQKLNKFGSNNYKQLNPSMKKVFVKIVNENLIGYLNYISCPTIIVWAKDDKETPFYMAKILNKNIKNSGIILLKGGGHFAYLKHHNQFVKILEYFINFKE